MSLLFFDHTMYLVTRIHAKITQKSSWAARTKLEKKLYLYQTRPTMESIQGILFPYPNLPEIAFFLSPRIVIQNFDHPGSQSPQHPTLTN